MAGNFVVKVEGLSDLDRRLREFGPRVAANGLRSATYAGAKVMLEAVKDSAPVRTGLLRANLVTKRRRTPNDQAKYSVVVKNAKATYGDTKLNRRLRRVGRKYTVAGPAFYAYWVEFGNSRMTGHPFMRPAFLQNIDAATQAVRNGLQKAIDRETRRRAKSR